jgi:His-Xaa-Ser system radical SAM maturase HxsC
MVLRLADRGDGTATTAVLGKSPVTGETVALANDAWPQPARVPEALSYLAAGDVVRVVPTRGELNVLYRRASPHNTMLMTEQCNSNCLMCSQPPKAAPDDYLVDVWLAALPLMSPETIELGISGGEPTLLGDRFISILAACAQHLPSTAVHVLSNGRLFNYLSLAQSVARVGNRDLMIGIPVYSDIASHHDFVVQAVNAFDQTIRGIINLKRCGVRVEIRVVLHRQTIGRLPQLGRFIARNLPFVDHVALMGLEMMGYTRANLEGLWIDPADYQRELAAAVAELRDARMNVSIYNHQLCVLDRVLWPFARKSISDWKNEFVEACGACSVRERCGGFFASSAKLKYSAHIAAVSQ